MPCDDTADQLQMSSNFEYSRWIRRPANETAQVTKKEMAQQLGIFLSTEKEVKTSEQEVITRYSPTFAVQKHTTHTIRNQKVRPP